MSEWRPIDEAPRDGTRILGWNGEYEAITSWRNEFFIHPVWEDESTIDPDWEVHPNFGTWAPTHWMPLPEPPAP